MNYCARPPRGVLHAVVDLFWRIEDSSWDSAPQTICPDGRTEIVLHLGAPMRQFEGARSVVQPQHIVVGQMTEPLLVAATGPCRMVGARLAPSALHRLLPIAQHDLIGQVIDATSIWNDWTRRTVEQVANAPTADAQLAIFERALEGLLVTRRNVSTVDAVIQRGVWRFEASGGLMSINTLARNAGVSRRQFERYFRAHVGMSPHMFGRIVRFQRAFRGLGHEPAAAIAARCGFADQAHLAREVRRFAGQTPTALAQAEGLTAILR